MAGPSEAEFVALEEAGPLLRFAAEKIKDLDSNLSLSIAQAQAAVKDGSWTPQTSEVFWNAFSKLCDLIQPVTMDSIAAANRNIAPSKWKFWKTEKNISVAERSSRRYLKALFALILIIMPLQLYVWTCTNLAKKIDDLTSANQAIIAKNSESFRKLAAATATSSLEQPHNWTTEEGAELAQLDSGLEEIQSNSDRAEAEARLLRDLSTLFLSRYAPGLPAQTVNENDWYRRYIGLLSRNSQRQIDILKIEEQANLIVGTIASFILPVLFGAAGAVAFAIRAISDEIRQTTFSQNSPIRHLMRVGLGALAGVVVGLFNSLSSQLSLPPLALAFLAGYGVEAVFSMFDGLVDRFRQQPQKG